MAFTRDKNNGHPMSKTKVGSAIVVPSTNYDMSGDVGEPGSLPDYLKDDFPGNFSFDDFDGTTDSKGGSHNDILNGGDFDSTYWNTVQHSSWFRDTGSTTT